MSLQDAIVENAQERKTHLQKKISLLDEELMRRQRLHNERKYSMDTKVLRRYTLNRTEDPIIVGLESSRAGSSRDLESPELSPSARSGADALQQRMRVDTDWRYRHCALKAASGSQLSALQRSLGNTHVATNGGPSTTDAFLAHPTTGDHERRQQSSVTPKPLDQRIRAIFL